MLKNTNRFMIAAIGFLICWSPVSLTAQATSPLAPESNQFDFWLGDWETEMSSIPNFANKRTGQDSVRSLLKGRLIEEVFTRKGDGEKFQRGYLTYLARDKQWQHIIYDAKWGEYRFLGGKRGDKFVLETDPDDTRPLRHRETFSEISKDHFNYTWQSSRDNGKTWNDTWKVKYRRAKKPPEGSRPPSSKNPENIGRENQRQRSIPDRVSSVMNRSSISGNGLVE